MSWATLYIQKLQKGETIQCRPHGNSMLPKIKSGQLCTIEPVDSYELKINDIVLCKIKGKQYLHLISAIKADLYQISNNHGFVNGWTNKEHIYGILTKVEN